MTALHVLFSSVFSFCAWGDLAQTGAAYSATYSLNANAAVLIVFAFVPHFEFDNFRNKIVACSHLHLRVVYMLFVA